MMMFRTLALPISRAISVTGTFTTLTSVRVISLLTMELLMNSVPPGTSLYGDRHHAAQQQRRGTGFLFISHCVNSLHMSYPSVGDSFHDRSAV